MPGRLRARAVLAALLATAVAGSTWSGAFAASLTYSDGICEHRVTYDRKKVDGARLKATLDYVNDGAAPLEPGPAFTSAEAVASIDIAAYRAQCAAHRRKLEAPRFIDLPNIEDLRRREIADLAESCRLTEASLFAAKGDTKPMRAAAPACLRYADLLDLPVKELKVRFNDLVLDLCQKSTQVNVCAGQMQRDGEGPGSEARRRAAVITRWAECATSKSLEEAGQADSPSEREKRRLKDILAKRFKAKTLSCAQ